MCARACVCVWGGVVGRCVCGGGARVVPKLPFDVFLYYGLLLLDS